MHFIDLAVDSFFLILKLAAFAVLFENYKPLVEPTFWIIDVPIIFVL